ncbi:MAG: FRG domain-containing protein [Rhodospirillales bacterium]|nr:FRG domain-containing protein [Rhodospirillales bacterium]
MDTIGQQKIWSFVKEERKATPTTCVAVRQSEAILVDSFMELARKVAELQFLNRDFVLMFRGQNTDWRNKAGNTTLKPEIFRGSDSKKVPAEMKLKELFERLEVAESLLVTEYPKVSANGGKRLRRQQILRWSILQHYKVCSTPLLDVTHSLRIAASFASEDARSTAYVFVLGLPNFEWGRDSKC